MCTSPSCSLSQVSLHLLQFRLYKEIFPYFFSVVDWMDVANTVDLSVIHLLGSHSHCLSWWKWLSRIVDWQNAEVEETVRRKAEKVEQLSREERRMQSINILFRSYKQVAIMERKLYIWCPNTSFLKIVCYMSWNGRGNVFFKEKQHLNVKISLGFWTLPSIFSSFWNKLGRMNWLHVSRTVLSEMDGDWWKRFNLQENCIKIVPCRWLGFVNYKC